MKPEVIITEPATMLTDYLLGVWILFFMLRLWEQRKEKDETTFLMLTSFAFGAFASFTGGTFHGWSKYLSPVWSEALWFCAMWGIGLAGAFLLLATVKDANMGVLRRRGWWWVGWLSAGMFTITVFRETTLDTLGLYYGPVIGAATWLNLQTYFQTKSSSAKEMLISVVISLISGVVQKFNIGFNEYFNGNDVCHIIFMVSIVWMYRAALVMKTKT